MKNCDPALKGFSHQGFSHQNRARNGFREFFFIILFRRYVSVGRCPDDLWACWNVYTAQKGQNDEKVRPRTPNPARNGFLEIFFLFYSVVYVSVGRCPDDLGTM